MNDNIWTLVKWVVGLVLVAVFVWFNRDSLSQATELSLDATLFFTGVAVYIVALLLTFYRWYVLVRALDLPFRMVDSVRLGFVGYFFGVVAGTVPGDMIRAGFAAREQERRTLAVSSIIVDRIIGLLGLIIFVSVVGAFYWDEVQDKAVLETILVFVWIITASAILFVLVAALLPVSAEPLIEKLRKGPKVLKILGELVHAFQLYHRRKGALAWSLVIAMVGHIGFVASFWFAAKALAGLQPWDAMHYLLIPVGMVVQAVPMTPGNLGINEELFKQLYNLARPGSGPDGLWTCLVQRLMTWIVALISLVVYLRLRRTIREVLAQEQADEQALAPEVTETPAFDGGNNHAPAPAGQFGKVES